VPIRRKRFAVLACVSLFVLLVPDLSFAQRGGARGGGAFLEEVVVHDLAEEAFPEEVAV